MKRRIGALALGGALLAVAVVLHAWSARPATPGVAEVVGVTGTRIVVFKGPACGCCDQWETHLAAAGFQVESRTTEHLRAKRKELGIDPSYSSCHTAVVDGYFIEGHVPADVIIRLLKTRPPVAGLAVPGMPIGSPGMASGPASPYEVYAVDQSGKRTVYATR